MSAQIVQCPKCRKRCSVSSQDLSKGLKCPECGFEVKTSVSASHDLHGAEDPLINLEFGGCKVLKLLGHGVFGSVYKAKHLTQGSIVALKLLPPSIVERFPKFFSSYSGINRRLIEVQHPNLVRVFDVGKSRGFRFTVMQYIEGDSLAERFVRRPKLPLPDAIRIIRSVAFGLRTTAGLGIIHRNLKPENIFLCKDGAIRISDFGLGPDPTTELGDSTIASAILVPHYLSPEQVSGEPIDFRSDIFSIGALLYRSIVGEVPFPGENPLVSMMLRVKTDSDSVFEREPSITKDIDPIIRTMMAKKPKRRYGSYSELISALDNVFSESLSEMPTELPLSQDSPPPSLNHFKSSTGLSDNRDTDGTDTEINDLLETFPMAPGTRAKDSPRGRSSELDEKDINLDAHSSFPEENSSLLDQSQSKNDFEKELTDQMAQINETHFSEVSSDRISDFGSPLDDESLVPLVEDVPAPPPGPPSLSREEKSKDPLTLIDGDDFLNDDSFLDEPPIAPTTAQDILDPPPAGVLEQKREEDASFIPPQVATTPPAPALPPPTMSHQKTGHSYRRTSYTQRGTPRRRNTLYDVRKKSKRNERVVLLTAIGCGLTFMVLGLIFLFVFSTKEKAVSRTSSMRSTARQTSKASRKSKPVSRARAAYKKLMADFKRQPEDIDFLYAKANNFRRQFPKSPYTLKVKRVIAQLNKKKKNFGRKEWASLKQKLLKLQEQHRWGDALEWTKTFSRSHRGTSLEKRALAEIKELKTLAAVDYGNLSHSARTAEDLGNTKEALDIYLQISSTFNLEPYVNLALQQHAEVSSSRSTLRETMLKSPQPKVLISPKKKEVKTESKTVNLGYSAIDKFSSEWRFHRALEECEALSKKLDDSFISYIEGKKTSISQVIQLKVTIVRKINQREQEFNAEKLFVPSAPGTLYRADDRGLIVRNGFTVARFPWNRIKGAGALILAKAAVPKNEDDLRRSITLLLIELKDWPRAQQEIQRLEAEGLDMAFPQQRLEMELSRLK